MEPLKDWYRYVDQVSRPARKDDPGRVEEEAAPWRPWKQESGRADDSTRVEPSEVSAGAPFSLRNGPATIEEEAAPGRVVPPPLFENLAPGVVHAGTFLPAGRHYEDLTVNDTLQPIPEFSVPRLSAPLLEFEAPRIPGRAPSETEPAYAEPPVAFREAVETLPAPTAAPSPDFRLRTPAAPSAEPAGPALVAHPAPTPAPPPTVEPSVEPPAARTPETPARAERIPEEEVEEGDRDDKAPRHWDLLTQIRGRDVAQNSYKSPFQETREELVQRLLDPELTLEETARLLDVCPTTVRRYTNKGQLRCFRTPGNQRRFRLSDIVEFMGDRVTDPHAETTEEADTDD